MTGILKSQDVFQDDNASLPACAHSHDKISVFISSSMRDEGDFSWTGFRKEISGLLQSSELFHPFAIEEHVSPLPSEQYYLAKVQQCDVVVSLIKGELRAGTENEIRFALECKKPLLLITIGDQRDKVTEDLVHYIHSIDYATTHNRQSTNGLAQFILDELYNAAALLFKGRLFQLNLGKMQNTAISGKVNHSVSRDAIAAFGESAALLARRYGYDLDWITAGSDNPFLEPLGEAAIQWLIDGEQFNVVSFFPTIQVAMNESGISERTLELRLRALDAFVAKDYKEAFLNARLSRESIAQKDSWLYGNCLIDERNMARCVPEEGVATQVAVQDCIAKLKVPVVFPLAEKYENNAAQQILRTARKYRTLSPRSTIYDNSLAGVLYDLCQLLFAAVLYGSIATFSYTRILVANALLDYAEVYSDESLAYEGVRLLVLAGDSKGFSKNYRAGIDKLSNSLKTNADSLWHLSGRGIEEGVPRMRCALVSDSAPYFSESVFLDVQEYLTSDPDLFRNCCQDWLEAINSIKLRMDQSKLAALLLRILDEKLYLTAQKVGRIIAGSKLSDFPEDALNKLATAMKERSSQLIKDGIPYYAFAAVEEATGVVVLEQDQVEAADDVEKSFYLDWKVEDKATPLACVNELLSQYRKNNTAGRHVEFGHCPAPMICDALDGEVGASVAIALEPVLGEILGTIGTYRGSLSSLDDSMRVLCKYTCALRNDGKRLTDEWVTLVSSIPAQHPTASTSVMFDRYRADTWTTRLHALRVATGIDDGLSYLIEGVSFDDLSFDAKLTYSESLAWLIDSGFVDSQYRALALKVCDAVSHAAEYQVRMEAPRCYAAFSKRWSDFGLEDALFSLARDPSDAVVYKLLGCCKAGSFGNPALEARIVDILSHDANWFIRWHAEHDE